MHKNVYMLALLLALFLPFTNVVAQGTSTTATVVGTVSDSKGNPLPGATVIAVHKPSGTIFGTSSRADGKYTIQNVRVGGPYEITSSFVGYNKYVETIKYLSLSQVFTLNIVLVETNMQLQEMTVIGTKDPILNSGRTGAATSVLKEQIEKLPTISRSFQDFAKLSPLFSGSSLSAGGRNAKLNNIQLDGTQYNDMFGLGDKGTPGGQANTNPISLDAIQEFQVVIAPFDVRQSGFTGGGINAITKSGTNNYEGSVYYFNRNENFVGKSPDTKKLKYSEFSEFQTGFRVGGPIIKDNLFFFANGEITKRKLPVSNSVLKTSNGALLDSLSNLLRSTLISKYGYDPGTTGEYTTERPSQKFFARFDWNLAEGHNLTLRHNYVSADDDILPRTSGVGFSDRVYTFKNSTNSTVLQLTSTLGSNYSNELIFGYTRIRDKRVVDGAFPSLVIWTPITGQNIFAGTEEFSIANKLDQDVFEFTDNFSYYVGDHVLTVGTHNEFFSFSNLFIRNPYGLYTFKSVDDFIAGKDTMFERRYSLLPNDPMFAPEFKVRQFGFYAQDEWTVTPALKLTLGIRFDIPTLPDAPAKNDSVAKYFGGMGYGTNILPKNKLLFSPRFGFNWDVHEDKSFILRGGIGVFTGKIPYVWISNQYSNTGVEFADISRRDRQTDPARFVADPYAQPKAGSPGITIGTTEINITDPDFKMPQVFRFNLGADHKLPMNLVASVDYLYSKNLNDLLYKDLNIGSAKLNLLDGRPYYADSVIKGSKITNSRISTQFQRVMLLTNTSDGYQTNLSFQVQGEPVTSLNTYLAYAYGVAKDRNSVTSSQARSQFRFNPIPGDPNNPPLTTSNFEVKHRILASVSYAFEVVESYKTTVSIFYNGQSGRPYSYRYDGDVNADGHDANDLIYIPATKDDYIYVPTDSKDTRTAATIGDQFWAYVNRDEYLKDHKGQIMERNGAREPWVSQFDIRIAQAIPTVYNQSLEISLDILNVANLLNSDWGWQKIVPNQADALLKPDGTDKTTGKLRVKFTDKNDPYVTDNLLSRFQMQLGLRYNF